MTNFNIMIKKPFIKPVPEAHAYNPSYSEGRDQEDRGSKAAQANSSSRDTISKKPFTKIGLVEWFKV
jgi:hypothetical protein